MGRKRKIYEGKAKILYQGPDPGTLIAYFKDDMTAFDASKKAVLDGKGVLNNRISEFLMTRLNAGGIPTHFIRRLNMREQLVQELDVIPLEVVCRNVAAGSLCKRLGLKEGDALPRSLIELYYKDDALGDPLVSEEHVNAFNWASHQEIDDMISLTFRANDFLCGLFSTVGIRLVDFKLEFGRHYQSDMVRILIADEISPDCCRLWDMTTGNKLDKDRFRNDLGDVTESYAQVATRLGVIRTNAPDSLDEPIVPIPETPSADPGSLRSRLFSRGKKP